MTEHKSSYTIKVSVTENTHIPPVTNSYGDQKSPAVDKSEKILSSVHVVASLHPNYRDIVLTMVNDLAAN